MSVDQPKWEDEAFEDMVSAGIICQFEKYKTKLNKSFQPPLRPDNNAIELLKKIGVYFSPGDRIIATDGHCLLNDPLPNYFSWGNFGMSMVKEWESYVRVAFGKRISALEKGWGIEGGGKPIAIYQVHQLSPHSNGDNTLMRFNFAIDANGNVMNTYCSYDFYDPNRRKYFKARDFGDGLNKDVEATYGVNGFIPLEVSVDRRFLWNVEAQESGARCIFGVYPDQIKSLFYARDLPMSKTGRKSPILHWVSSHRRRIKEGTSVDVKRHLRGITEFEMGGTGFRITNPEKS